MKTIYLTFILCFFGILLNCNNTKSKESETQIALEKSVINEIFSLVKPINKPKEPLYYTQYDGCSILIRSNSDYQELVFKKGNIETVKILKFYYENPEIVFHLYKSNNNNYVLLIEGRDYYSSNLGVYYIDNKNNKIIEIDDTLSYNQDDPETKGFKLPKAEIYKNENELVCRIYLESKLIFDKSYKIYEIEKNIYHEQSMLKDILQKNISTPEKIIDSLVFTRDKRDSLQINIEILNYISKTTTRENGTYLFALENYAQKDRENLGWTINEMSIIKAYIFNTSYPLRKEYWADKFDEWYNGKPEYLLGDRGSWEENNYYGLPKLEEYVLDFIVSHHWTQY